jgi:hypothetical protein
MKDSAIRYLTQIYIQKGAINYFEIEQAKAMFDEQIMEAYRSGRVDQQRLESGVYSRTAKDYLKKTYSNKSGSDT